MIGSLHIRTIVIFAALLAVSAPTAAADKRVALVIGNTRYEHIPSPATAVNDARLVARTLRSIGFTEVLEFFDLDRAAMMIALDTFAARAETADWALIYYAGHGLQVYAAPYLAPTDAKLAKVGELNGETIKLTWLLAKPQRALKLRIVILDMPRANHFGILQPRARDLIVLNEGDELVAFATQPGGVLSRREGENGAFALALARHMIVPGVEISEVFRRIRDDVLKATSYKQVPWESVRFSGLHYFVP